jgi:arginase family enzyme
MSEAKKLKVFNLFDELFQDPLHPLVLGGDHSISFPVVRAVSEKLGGPVDILHLDAHPDIYHCFEGNKYSHASSFARIMEGGYARRLLQVCVYVSICFSVSHVLWLI